MTTGHAISQPPGAPLSLARPSLRHLFCLRLKQYRKTLTKMQGVSHSRVPSPPNRPPATHPSTLPRQSFSAHRMYTSTKDKRRQRRQPPFSNIKTEVKILPSLRSPWARYPLDARDRPATQQDPPPLLGARKQPSGIFIAAKQRKDQSPIPIHPPDIPPRFAAVCSSLPTSIPPNYPS